MPVTRLEFVNWAIMRRQQSRSFLSPLEVSCPAASAATQTKSPFYSGLCCRSSMLLFQRNVNETLFAEWWTTSGEEVKAAGSVRRRMRRRRGRRLGHGRLWIGQRLAAKRAARSDNFGVWGHIKYSSLKKQNRRHPFTSCSRYITLMLLRTDLFWHVDLYSNYNICFYNGLKLCLTITLQCYKS